MRASTYLCAIGILATATVGSAVAAQEAGPILRNSPPARLPDRKMKDADEGRYVANAYASCLLGRKPTAVVRALELPLAKSGRVFEKIATSECLAINELRMPSSLLRGAAFLALYKRDYAAAAPSVARQVDYVQDSVHDGLANPEVAMRMIASCVQKANPAGVRTLILAPVATDAENRAFSVLKSNLSACLPGAQKIRFSRAALQAVFAEVAYREGTPGFSNAKTAGIR